MNIPIPFLFRFYYYNNNKELRSVAYWHYTRDKARLKAQVWANLMGYNIID